MQGFLPDSVLQKSKHGFGLPFGVWMNNNESLSGLVSDSLHALGRRGVFSSDALDRILKLHREGHASYYGELIWLLMVLELWLQETERRFNLKCSF
jgi:asparagine synthase (glutamine-hydrolysing)